MTIITIDSLLCDIGRKDQEVRADWAKVATGNVSQDEVVAYAAIEKEKPQQSCFY